MPEMYTGSFVAITRFATARDQCMSKQLKKIHQASLENAQHLSNLHVLLLIQRNQR